MLNDIQHQTNRLNEKVNKLRVSFFQMKAKRKNIRLNFNCNVETVIVFRDIQMGKQGKRFGSWQVGSTFDSIFQVDLQNGTFYFQ